MSIIETFKVKYFPTYFKRVFIPIIQSRQKRIVQRIRKRGNARVAFIVSNLSMWRCQKLYELLLEDTRFEPFIVLFPFKGYDQSQRIKSIRDLKDYFETNKTEFHDLSNEKDPSGFFREVIKPDIVFYPQPYYDLLDQGMASENLEDFLLCYVPYGLNIYHVLWLFNQRFSNVAWRLYYSSLVDLDSAKEFAYNKGRNVKIVGNPKAEEFTVIRHTSVWKPQEKTKKKVIWAPHYSITDNGLMYQGNFLDLYDGMIKLAKRYSDSIQFAFKPHPLLATVLHSLPDWGKERTDDYYRQWATMPNTQLETDGYVDLFMTSDAMIHDCGSFTAEYQYTGKPALFLTSNKSHLLSKLSKLGEDALNAHYFGKGIDDIEHFLLDVVLDGKDNMAETRKKVYSEYLLPPNGKSAAENIFDDLVNSLWPDD